MSDTVQAVCIVKIAVECSSNWGSDCTMDQIVKQATEGARERIAKLFHDSQVSDEDLKTTRRDVRDLRYLGVSDIETKVISKR